MTAYNPADNSYRSWKLAINALRERQIRDGVLKPRRTSPLELRWAAEGPRPFAELDTVRKV